MQARASWWRGEKRPGGKGHKGGENRLRRRMASAEQAKTATEHTDQVHKMPRRMQARRQAEPNASVTHLARRHCEHKRLLCNEAEDTGAGDEKRA